MTVHAGQKAARLRRATNSSATGVNITPSIKSSSSSQSLLSGKDFLNSTSQSQRNSTIEDLLAPSTSFQIGGQADLLGKHQEIIPATAFSSATPPKKSKNGYGTKRKNNNKKAHNGLSSTSTTDASGQNFIFSGLEPAPVSKCTMKDSNWRQHGIDDQDVSVSSTVSDIMSPSPSLIFVAQPSTSKAKLKSIENQAGKSDVEKSNTSSPNASASTQCANSKKNSKSSPGKFMPWFSFSRGEAAAVAEDKKGVSDGLKGEGVTADVEKPIKRKVKKKRKKLKAKESNEGAEVEIASRDETMQISDTRKKPGQFEANPVGIVASELEKPAGKLQNRSSEHVKAETVPTFVEKEASSSSSQDSTSRGLSSADTDRTLSSIDRETIIASLNQDDQTIVVKSKGSQLNLGILDCAEVNKRYERRGSTETIYHTAVPTTPSWDNECISSRLVNLSSTPSSHTTMPLYSSTFPVVDLAQQCDCKTFSSNNSIVSMTEDSAITIEETQTSTQSSPKMGFPIDHLAPDSVTSPEIITEKKLPLNGRAELRHCSSNISLSRDVSLHSLQVGSDGKGASGTKSKDNGMAQLEKLQRTLHWRLASSNRMSPGANKETSGVAKDIDESTNAIGAAAYRGRSANSKQSSNIFISGLVSSTISKEVNGDWIHLLPSLEEIHPRRSIEREMTLRSLAWLGLEEYVARKSKSLLQNGRGGNNIVWITHTSFPRNAVLHRSKAPYVEPLLCSSAFWLRSASKGMIENKESSLQGMVDSIRAYQVYLRDRHKKVEVSLAAPQPLIITSTDYGTVGAARIEDQTTQSPTELECRETQAMMDHLQLPRTNDTGSCEKATETSQDLQRAIELCMYDLRHSKDKRMRDGAWLQSMSSIEVEEKSAIQAFFDSKMDEEWQTVDAREETIQQSPLYGPMYPEVAWPTTPYTPVDLITGLPTGLEENQQAGLSVNEMEEIEDAMYRDYLLQSNHYPRHQPRKKERGGGGDYHRYQNRSGEGRNRAHSSSRITHGSPISSSMGRAYTIDATSRCASRASGSRQESEGSDVAGQMQSLHNARRQSAFVSGGEDLSKEYRGGNQLSRQNSADRVTYSDTTQKCSQETLATNQKPEDEYRHSAATSKKMTYNESKQSHLNTKESENQAVQSSLANLQQHLALVSGLKQNGDARKSPRMSTLRQFTGSMPLVEAVSPILPLHKAAYDQVRWPLSSQASEFQIPDITSNTRHEQIEMQTDFQRQQFLQLSAEAKKLEERHLLSYAQAIDRSRQQSKQVLTQKQEEQKVKLDGFDRIQAALTMELARLGRLNTYSLQQPPIITLTEPSIQERRLKGNLKMNTRTSDMAPWSDNMLHMSEQLYTPRLNEMRHNASNNQVEAELQHNSLTRSIEIPAMTLSRRHSLSPLENNTMGAVASATLMQLSPTSISNDTYFPSLLNQPQQMLPPKVHKKGKASSTNALQSQQQNQHTERLKSRNSNPWQREATPIKALQQQQNQQQSHLDRENLVNRYGPIQSPLHSSSPVISPNMLR